MKRLFDILAASIALILLSPALGLLWIAIRFRMGRPVIFRQLRGGRDGRPFDFFKFRTMTNARDSAGALLSDSARLTTLGRWLRSTSLDELPQLWNVVIGDMSLIGPRPLLVEYLPLYTARQKVRHRMRPGITGWAQVNGRNSLDWSEKFDLDIWYVEHWCLWVDLHILWKTLKVTLFRTGVNHCDDATMPKFTG